MRRQFATTLVELGEDEKLVVLIGDISHYLLKDFETKYNSRFYNMGIAEQAMIGTAVGLAMKGFYPVVHSIAPFVVERCFEQIKNDVCYQKQGINIVSVGSAFDYAGLGCTHHSYNDIGLMRALPNMQVIYPASPHEFDILFKETYKNGKPTYFRLPEKKHSLKTNPKFGEVEKIKDGKDVTIVGAGPQIQNAYEAVEIVENEGITSDLFYITTIKPINKTSVEKLKESLKKTGKLITIEEHSIFGGVGDAIASACQRIPFSHYRMGIEDKFLENYGTYEEHCRENNLTRDGIVKIIYEITSKNSV